jgi:hypothetical protein
VIVAPEWWHDLHDPQLDRIMADALAGSPTLEDASARLRVVQALIANAKAALLPQVSGDVGSTYELLSNKYIYPAPLGGSGRWLSDAEVDIGWTLDLAGASTRWCAPHAPCALHRAAGGSGEGGAVGQRGAGLCQSGAGRGAGTHRARIHGQPRGVAEADAEPPRRSPCHRNRHRRGANPAGPGAPGAGAGRGAAGADGACAGSAGRAGADYYGAIGPTSLRPEATLPVPQSLPADLLARRADLLAAQLQVEMAAHGEKIQRAAFYPDVNLQALRGFRRWGSDRCLRAARPWRALARRCTCPSFRAGR